MKKISSTWILLFVTTVAVVYAYFFEFQKRKQDAETKDKEALIYPVDRDQVVRIEFRGVNAFEMKKEGDVWMFLHPIQDQADLASVNEFLSSLTKEKSDMEISEEKIDFSIYDLAEAKRSFRIETSDGKVTEFQVGLDALEGKQYLRRGNENAVLVGTSNWKNYASKTIPDFRSKELFRGKRDSIHEILIVNHAKNKETKIARKDGKWSIIGAKFEMDTRQVEAFANQLQNMRAQDVVAEEKKNLGHFGLVSPTVTLKLAVEGEKEPVVIQISGEQKDKNAYVISSSLKPVYKVYGGFSGGYAKTAADFRNRESPFQFDAGAVSKIKLHSELLQTELKKQNNEWKLAEQETAKQKDKEVDQAQVNHLISQLSRMRVREFLDSAPQLKSNKTVQLYGENDKLLFEAKIGGEVKNKNQYYISTNLTSEVVTVDDESVKMLPFSSVLRDITKKDETTGKSNE